MELLCVLAVVNRQGGFFEGFTWGSIIARNMNNESTTSEEPSIIIRTSSNTTSTVKFKIIGNIQDLSTRFLNEGRAAVCLIEPSYNIYITKADPDELTTFIISLKKLLPADSPVHVSMAALEPPTSQISFDCQEKYTLKMKHIIGLGTNLDHFTDLKICNCTLELSGDQVPIAGAIRNMKNLTTLQLEKIKLHSSTFLEIESKKLERLNCCWCDTRLPISSIFKSDLCYKDSLVELFLEWNQWLYVPNGIFQFGNLLKLSLSRNCITELPDKFTNLPKLQELSLSHNRLTHVPPSIFALQNLLKLSLSNNFISALPDFTINSSKLQVLLLSSNRLQSLPPSIFQFRNLIKLQLHSNLITELPYFFTNLSKLQQLELSHNQLRYVPPSIFTLQNLSELDLSDNLISELPNIFNLPKLNTGTLKLDNNQLDYMPSIIFALQNLSELDLSNNLITELPDEFTKLSKLKSLSLARNQLQYLPPSIFSLYLTHLDTEFNEFHFGFNPLVGSEMIVHSLKELSYRTILNHKVKVKEGMLPAKFLKDLAKYQQCVCGCKFVDEGQHLSFSINLFDISRFTPSIRLSHLRFPVRGQMCSSLKSCFFDRLTKCGSNR